MKHPLDRPVWSALAGPHAVFALGDARAKRYVPDVAPFAATPDDSPESLAALAALLPAQGAAILLQADGWALPRGSVAEKVAAGVQMVATAPPPPVPDIAIAPLTVADVPEMIALTALTEPGPFALRTHELGSFRGIRRDGRLVAMAGERMRAGAFVEVSGVCTHPDYRGRGYAAALSCAVTTAILARGETPFLHAYADNHAAIGLYRTLGFTLRSEMTVVFLRRG